MATLKDLSRTLGLSVTQISRALNGHDDVNADTRKRVISAAKAMNYQPNISARKLASGRSGIVGLVLPEGPVRPSDSLFVQMIGGLSRYFSQRGILFVLHMADPSEDPARVHERLINAGSLDGFVILDPQAGDRRITFLRGCGVPFVVHGRDSQTPDYAFFDIDNADVGYRLTRVLTDAGHRRIALLNGRADSTYAIQRRAGYGRALAECGITPAPDHHLGEHMTTEFGLLATIGLCQDPARRPTAIICGNTLIAQGVLDGLSALGLAVPRDVSVVAHDDDLPSQTQPAFPLPLTMTRAALSDGWQQLAELLVARIDGQPLDSLQRVGPVTLVTGASVAAPAD